MSSGFVSDLATLPDAVELTESVGLRYVSAQSSSETDAIVIALALAPSEVDRLDSLEQALIDGVSGGSPTETVTLGGESAVLVDTVDRRPARRTRWCSGGATASIFSSSVSSTTAPASRRSPGRSSRRTQPAEAMRRSIDDYPFDPADGVEGDDDLARISWAVAIADDYDDAEPRVVLTVEEVGRAGSGPGRPPHPGDRAPTAGGCS